MSQVVATPVQRPLGQRRVLIAVFVVLCVLLGAGYFFFLRTEYAVLYSSMRPTDAAAVVAQLDATGVPHRLRDNGTTILVPVEQADNVRVSLAGSDTPLHGGVGFELFNHSDMGLTDFAQKINYQRALQGELARTIMMMDGIDSARVHLAMPEHTLFRATQTDTKAAIEIIPRVGTVLTPDRVAGIQRLVAAAVPDLALADVVVLDGDGRVISQAPAPQAAPETQEQAAIQGYFAARAKSAVTAVMPGLELSVHALIVPPADGSGSLAATPDLETLGGSRTFGLRLTISTATTLGEDDRTIARNAVVNMLHLDDRHGDSLTFVVGPVADAVAPSDPARPIPTATMPVGESPSLEPGSSGRPNSVTLAVGCCALVVLGWLLFRSRRRAPMMPAADRDALVERIRGELSLGNIADA